MAYFRFDETTESDSQTDGSRTSEPSDSESVDPDGSPVIDRLVKVGETVMSIIEPWTTLLTAVVQALTVYQLSRKV